ncbi:Stp1/IreP family PP2C-type Ser/Thr phosphatase [Oceanobacillus sojae]|uniref:Stp1/IreP family PP2C-type Ser/Thr phosphatase n=1 Tax=Oceanobacillus sojae TaxID=582851 RepID=UPI0009883B43|nr:Stp1/IreP family PP2C-type Ser/Thr phosphatase [Oceanobacillus sojae]MCT1904187.1 Stp1/IreP family PP2C-type Ser/Thr phosphatase [Oceanobacillus sojae]
MKGLFLTHCGQVRNHNEDAGGIFENKTSQPIAIIADGMGGHKAGDVASMLAVENMKKRWEETEVVQSPNDIEQWLQSIIRETNEQIFRKSQENKQLEGMGTTLVAAVISGNSLTIAHIGDSRLYIARGEHVEQLTEDHSFVNELVKRGEITEGDAEVHPYKNYIIRALGTEARVDTDIKTLTWDAGDRLLLCSDGLSDKLSQTELAQFITADKGMNEIGQELIDLANERGGEDNISLILIAHDGSDSEAGEPA